MSNEKLVELLEELKSRLDLDVRMAYYNENGSGPERLNSWMKYAKKNLDPFSSDIFKELKTKPRDRSIYYGNHSEGGDFDSYKRKPLIAYLDSLIIDVQNGEFDFQTNQQDNEKPVKKAKGLIKKAFIVHGHNEATKLRTARFLEKLGFDAVILHEQANGGKTIIEKLEHFTDVGFGIVLYTPDDVGEALAQKDKLRPRARQNVVFEHGLLIGKLGRERVFPLVTDHSVELPGDISGMVYLSDNSWEFQLAKEIKTLGYEVDLNALVG